MDNLHTYNEFLNENNTEEKTEYKFNLAIVYDQNNDPKNALSLYEEVIQDYIYNKEITKSIPIATVRKRVQFLMD